MRDRLPTTKTMKISDVRGQLNTLVNRVYRKEIRLVVEKSGIPVAGLVSAEDLRRLDDLDRLERAREADFAVLDELQATFSDVPVEELERETDRITAEIRAVRARAVAESREAQPPLQVLDDAESVTNSESSRQQRSPGVASAQSPHEFYADLTQHRKVRTILSELAK